MWAGYKNYDHYFKAWSTKDIQQFIDEILESKLERIEVTRGHGFWNIPASFDIETSSYQKMGRKYATMYLWALCINGSTIIGRKWLQFKDIIDIISERFLTKKYHLIIYVHNLGYEFQFMRGWFQFDDVFAVKDRRPIHASLPNGIEFKCSYILSNYALAYIGNKIINKYHVKKDVGAVDYSLVRTWLTKLSDTEIWYNVHDVQVVTSYIQEKIENENGIDQIPLTNTGYVRNYCRNFCFTQEQTETLIVKQLKAKYHEMMKSLRITSQCEYDQLHQAFAGGFTHAAPAHSGQILHNVSSDDISSSYPLTMVAQKFPMGRGQFIGASDIESVEHLVDQGFCCLFTLHLENVYPKFVWENYISISKCLDISKNAVVNNGRVASADYLDIVITELDWDIIKNCYGFNKATVQVNNLRAYPSGYLPRPLILAILHLYEKKTTLKDVESMVVEYLRSKGMLNSTYGMAVTAIVRDLYEYSNTSSWLSSPGDVTSQLNQYNNSYNRFLFYAWGVWVTAHARHNLWEAIFEFGPDYVYSDTDSIKGLNRDKHELFFKMYNARIRVQLMDMCKFWDIPYSMCTPKTVDGETKIIGVFEREKDYKTFKTIGAKRYIYEYMNGFLNFTVSGVNKKMGVPYLLSQYGDRNFDHIEDYKVVYNPLVDQEELSKQKKQELLDRHISGELDYTNIFEHFQDGLYFPAEYTGKQTLTYIDDNFTDIAVDYQGRPAVCNEMSCIYMEPQSYFMSQTVEYLRFLEGYRDGTI